MRDFVSEIPGKVRLLALSMGESGRAWLAGLNPFVADLERRWAIEVLQLTPTASEAFVAEARTRDGRDVVLKAVLPGLDPTRQELRTLRAANGKGYAKLIRADETENVLLLEKLGPQLHTIEGDADKRVAIICAVLADAWMPLPEGPPFVTGAEKAIELANFIESRWSTLGDSVSQRTRDTVLACARRRAGAFDPAQAVLVHGDAHEWNTLRVPGSTAQFKFVDPDGAFAERAFDLAIPMREWDNVFPASDLLQLGHARCSLLAHLAGVAPRPIWEWAMVQCVSNALSLREIGLGDRARVPLAMAEAWAARGDWT
jgi:streptomycin 6-kinase